MGATLLILTIDGCLYDPTVYLPNGYEISAISGGSPSDLYYSANNDPATYSGWTARSALVDGRRMEYYLLFTEGDESLTFDSEDEWKSAILEKNADPTPMSAKTHDVTGYRTDDTHLIGKHGDGYFVLTYANHELETWQDRGKWSSEVEQRTQLQPRWLVHPKLPFVQSREPLAVLIYAGLFLLVVLYPRSKKPPS